MDARAVPDLEQLNRRFRPALISFFLRRCRGRAEAEDLTQEVFVRLAQARSEPTASTEAFIFRIATNLIRDRWRRDRVRGAYRSEQIAEQALEIDPLDPHRIVAGRETLGLLWAAIQALPEPTQQIFILYRVENIHKRVIADSFGLNVRTVEKHITRALLSLARRVGDWP